MATEIVPRTSVEALELWDRGEALSVFHVESEGASQEELWGAAFELIRKSPVDNLTQAIAAAAPKLSERERAVVESIVHTDKIQGWSRMIAMHIHTLSPAITIQNPKK